MVQLEIQIIKEMIPTASMLIISMIFITIVCSCYAEERCWGLIGMITKSMKEDRK